MSAGIAREQSPPPRHRRGTHHFAGGEALGGVGGEEVAGRNRARGRHVRQRVAVLIGGCGRGGASRGVRSHQISQSIPAFERCGPRLRAERGYRRPPPAPDAPRTANASRMSAALRIIVSRSALNLKPGVGVRASVPVGVHGEARGLGWIGPDLKEVSTLVSDYPGFWAFVIR